MQVRRGRRTRKRLGLTPLVDVVFLLLVFFMLANRPPDAPSLALALSSPTPGSGASGSAPLDSEAPLRLRVSADGALILGEEAVTRDELAARLRAHAGRGRAELALVPAAGLPLQPLVELLDLSAAAGITDTRLLRSFER